MYTYIKYLGFFFIEFKKNCNIIIYFSKKNLIKLYSIPFYKSILNGNFFS